MQKFFVLHDEQEGNVGGAARGPVDYRTMGGETNGQQKNVREGGVRKLEALNNKKRKKCKNETGSKGNE